MHTAACAGKGGVGVVETTSTVVLPAERRRQKGKYKDGYQRMCALLWEQF